MSPDRLIRLVFVLALVIVAAALMTHYLPCFGCGGLEYPEDASPAERQAIQDRMVEGTIALVQATVVFVVLLLAGQVAWTTYTERQEDGG